MDNEKIIYKFDKGFNRSSKIMEHRIGIDEARLLNTLIYKYNYWVDEDRMVKLKEGDAFWITIPNLQGETNLKPFTIKNAIKKLKKLKLVEVYKKGIPAKNHFILNKKAILEFDDKYKDKYESWLDELSTKAGEDRSRFPKQFNKTSDEDEPLVKETTSAALIIPQSAEKSPTSELVFRPLVNEYSTVTNNKSTNNKNTNTTNRKNADRCFINYDEQEEEIEKLIDNFKLDYYDDNDKQVEDIYNYLINLVSKMEKFKMSDDDYNLIMNISKYSLKSYDIASKIISNSKDISEGIKEVRFGNLFVGLREIDLNNSNKYS